MPNTLLASYPAFILAGGLGTRISNIVGDKLPKALIEIQGVSIIHQQLDFLEKQGITEVVVCIGHLGTTIQERVGNQYKNISINYSHEKQKLGTAGALRYALDLGLVTADKIFVLNGDCLYSNFNMYKLVNTCLYRNRLGAIAAVSRTDTSGYGTVGFDGNNSLQYFKEKTNKIKKGYVSCGVYLLDKKLLYTVPATTKQISIEYDMFPKWINDMVVVETGDFIDIGTPEIYNKVMMLQ